jgi:pilus assembly protein FimV
MDFELELDELEDNTEPNGEDLALESDAGAGDELGGDLGIDFNPDDDSATDLASDLSPDLAIEEAVAVDQQQEATDSAAHDIEYVSPSPEGEQSAAVDEAVPADEPVDESEPGGFGKMEELTIDADLEEAAANISNENAESGSAVEPALDRGDLAVEADLEEESLDDLEFEAVTTADDDFEFQDEGDSANTKLDLARAYVDMGDADGARDILKEVMDEGNSDQQQKAQAMLESL